MAVLPSTHASRTLLSCEGNRRTQVHRCVSYLASPNSSMRSRKCCQERSSQMLRDQAQCVHSTSESGEGRVIGCSDLYSMTEAINAQSQADSTLSAGTQPSSGSSATTGSTETQVSQEPNSIGQQQHATSSDASVGGGRSYYTGLLTTDLRVDNQATGADMLKRSLQFAGGAAGILVLLTYLFLASNNLA